MLRKNDQNVFNASNAIKKRAIFRLKINMQIRRFFFFFFFIYHTRGTKLFSFGIKIKKKKNKRALIYTVYSKNVSWRIWSLNIEWCVGLSLHFTPIPEMARWKIDKRFRFYVCDSPDNVFTLSKTRMHSSLFDETTQALYRGNNDKNAFFNFTLRVTEI